MNPWRPYPLIRLVAAFILGIFTAVLHWSEVRVGVIPLAAILGAVIGLAAFPGFISNFRYRWIRGALIFISLVLLGNQYTLDFLPGWFGSGGPVPVGKEKIYAAVISGQPAVREKTVRITAQLFVRDSITRNFSNTGKALLYVKTDQRSQRLINGDVMIISGNAALLPPPAVPGGFDMRGYFARQGIFLQVYLPSEKWKFLIHLKSFSLMGMAGKVRDKLLQILLRNNVTGEEFAVAAALLLGYVSEIDRELLSDYSSTGAMHILSVSGMHVGVIYLFLEFLLGLAERKRRESEIAAWLRATIMVVSIWAYALITGLSPPVQRAAIMLSMVIVGKSMKRQPDVLNILAASLFLILLSNPFLVLDTGCQFSYLAVAGIVLMYKPVYDLYVTSQWFPDKVWSLIAVSLAAQLITFPLGLYVFHQFPNYFLLTNLLAVPWSSLVIYAGILLLAVGSVPWLGPLTGKTLSLMVWLLNTIIRMIDALPGSVTKGIFITLPETFLLYAMILFVFLFFLRKKKLWLFLFLVSGIFFSASLLEHRITNNERKEIVIYQGKTTNIDFIYGESHFLLMQDPLKPPDEFTRGNLANHWASKGITRHYLGYLKPDARDTSVQNVPGFIHRCGNCILFGGKRIVILNKSFVNDKSSPFSADILVISQGLRFTNEEIRIYIDAKKIIGLANKGYTLITL